MVKISVSKLKNNLENILGLKISKAWKGYGSALFLELGTLHAELAMVKDNETAAIEVGEFTLSSVGAWKLFKGNKKVLDAEIASSADIHKAMKDLDSLTIQSIKVAKNLLLKLSNNMTLEFYKTDYGFFTLVSNEKPFISYEDNVPHAYQQFYI